MRYKIFLASCTHQSIKGRASPAYIITTPPSLGTISLSHSQEPARPSCINTAAPPHSDAFSITHSHVLHTNLIYIHLPAHTHTVCIRKSAREALDRVKYTFIAAAANRAPSSSFGRCRRPATLTIPAYIYVYNLHTNEHVIVN